MKFHGQVSADSGSSEFIGAEPNFSPGIIKWPRYSAAETWNIKLNISPRAPRRCYGKTDVRLTAVGILKIVERFC